MDAPNAPNLTNPNAQDQFVDVVQGPTNQAQGPAIQNLAPGPADQNQVQGPAVQNQGPAVQNSRSRFCSSWSEYTHPSATTTGPSTTSPCRYYSASSSGSLSKLDRKET